MKNPRLPGAEKFKFSGHEEDDDKHSQTSNFIRGGKYRKTCPPSMRTSNFSRSEPKRRPILPITSKTSRVLCNTGLEVSSLDKLSLNDTHSSITYRQDNLDSGTSAPRNNNGRISWPLFGSLRMRGHRSPSDDYTPTDSPRSSTCMAECTADRVDILSSNDSIQDTEWSSHSSFEDAIWLPRDK